MQKPKEYVNERERLKDLESYSILDTLSESDYDDLTAIAAELCGTKISLITLVDDTRQWFKSHHGIDVSETPKEYAFCAHAINEPENVFIVQDARKDLRFYDNPLVTNNPTVIFYAGVSLLSDNNHPLGTLCVIDNKPKTLSDGQIQALKALGNQVMNILNLRKTKLTLEKALISLEEKNQELDRFAFVAAHDLKSPLAGISGLSNLFIEEYGSQIDDEGKEMLALIEESSDVLRNLIDGLLKYSRCENIFKEDKSEIDLNDLLKNISAFFPKIPELKINLRTSINKIHTNRTAINQILINLVTNAIKYNDKETIEIEIGVASSETHYEFYVQDNGPGIAEENQAKIFEIFEVIAKKDRFGKSGNGIGLATVKKVVEKGCGSIKVESKLKKGTKFIFTIEK
ncbi:sensor histidine kinase [Yeosuana aromativorans]|uniref:histidine kinase n=1 Tax=Yeosuana aromativorans TaxID=288019 RepID=A0A8J3BU73_9FLAO|nr:ATP-binding protein [Yeosuana aromativorans]GGK35457.1 sensor histidine kinase [Yeosuana aromativorans]